MYKIVLVAMAILIASINADNIDKDAHILNFKNEPADAEGNYAYAFDTSNGIQQQEAGNPTGVAGDFKYVSPDGETIAVSYTADEHGFQPHGAHLPTPPPIPDAILKALDYIAAHPQQNDETKN